MVISVRHWRQTSWARIRSNGSKRRRMHSTSSVMLKTVSIIGVGVDDAMSFVDVVGSWVAMVVVVDSVVVIVVDVIGDLL